MTKLKILRDQKGLTVAKASEEMGIPHSTLSLIEGGRMVPTQDVKKMILEYYGLPEETLFEVYGLARDIVIEE